MKKCFFTLFIFSASLEGVDPARLLKIDHESNAPHYHDLNTEELKNLIHKDKSLIILDARTEEGDDGYRIQGAKLFPFNSSDADIQKTLPLKDASIVVYCTNKNCAASTSLADRLVAMGYTNVYKYPEGIHAWIKAGYRLDRVK